MMARTRHGRCAYAFLCALIALAAASAQELGGKLDQLDREPGPNDQFVTFQEPPQVTVSPGRPARIALRFAVTDGNHVNSSKPKSEFLIPTRLKLNAPTDLMIGRIEYPAGRDMSFAFSPDEKLNVYTGPFDITGLVSADRTASPGQYRVHGELTYQACNNRACFPPRHLPVAFNVRVLPGRRTRHNPPQSPHVHQ
jgi:hypothetical protein